MTLEEFKEKYIWSRKFDQKDMMEFMVFFMSLHLRMAIEKDASSLDNFMHDLKKTIREK